jgi:beta-glucanase (GH16 family)
MKKFNRILLILILGYSCFSAAIFIKYLHPEKGQWDLVWKDDFNSPVLDQTKWMAVDRGGGYRGFSGYQEEISIITPENVIVKKGCLKIFSLKKDWIGPDIIHPGHTVAGQFTSGQVVTKYSYTWGRFEIRAELPVGRGLFSYASLYPVDGQSSQILIMGMLGYDPYTIYMSNYWRTDQLYCNVEETVSGRSYGPDYSTGFHTFAVEWEPQIIRWYIDDVQIDQAKRNIPDLPLLLSLGTTIGEVTAGNSYNKLKPRGGFNSWPQYFTVDWVRVYRRR